MSATVEELREALQFAVQELREAEDKLWVSFCNHPGDRGIENKDSLWAIHAREDHHRLEGWSRRAGNAANEIRNILVK